MGNLLHYTGKAQEMDRTLAMNLFHVDGDLIIYVPHYTTASNLAEVTNRA